MNKKSVLKYFSEIYDKTYANTLRYVILHCNNIDDVKDIIQDTYLNFYKYLLKNKHKIESIENIDNYIIGISKNTLKNYYYSRSKSQNILSFQQDKNIEMIIDIDSNLELDFVTNENVKTIWKYIYSKGTTITKIFYAYYHLGMKINEISKELQINESTVKNYIYRTIKELKKIFKEENLCMILCWIRQAECTF